MCWTGGWSEAVLRHFESLFFSASMSSTCQVPRLRDKMFPVLEALFLRGPLMYQPCYWQKAAYGNSQKQLTKPNVQFIVSFCICMNKRNNLGVATLDGVSILNLISCLQAPAPETATASPTRRSRRRRRRTRRRRRSRRRPERETGSRRRRGRNPRRPARRRRSPRPLATRTTSPRRTPRDA